MIRIMLFMCLVCVQVTAEEIGRVDTKFNLLSPDDKIRIEVVEDSKIEGIACYLSRAQKGGYSGALGLAEDTSDASIECRQVGPIIFNESFEEGEAVFRERRSLIFKSLKIIRFCDVKRNAVVYLAYSERIIEGSPKNSVTAVPIRKWSNEEVGLPTCRYEP